MTTIHFFFKQSLKEGKQGSIGVRITHHRKTKTITLPIKVFPKQWDKQNECILTDDNLKLKETEVCIQKIVANLHEKGGYTVDQVVNLYHCQTKGKCLLTFVKFLTVPLLKNGQERTARAYMSTYRKFLKLSGLANLTLLDITISHVENFEKALLQEGLTRNTVSFYMRNLQSIYNKSIQMQEISVNGVSPFTNVFTGSEKTRKRALNMKEIGLVSNVNFNDKYHLKRAQKLFFFGLHACGMSFVDMAYLKKTDIKNGLIRYRRRKTGKLIQVKLTQPLQELIDYFFMSNPNMPYLLPIITNKHTDERLQYESGLSRQNKSLKTLGKLCHLKQPLTTHVCRHSWASLAHTLNAPVAVICESLGHSDEKTTGIYLSSLDQSLLDRVSENVSSLVTNLSKPNYRFQEFN